MKNQNRPFARAYATALLSALLLATCIAVPGRSAVVSYSKDTTTTVTAVNTYPGYVRYVMYSVGPLTVSAGDVVSAHFQQQLNYNGSVNVMLCSGIIVGTSATVADTGTGFVGWVARSAGSNISAAEEGSCEVLSRTGSYKFTAAATNIYVNAFVYGGCSVSAPDCSVPGGGELVAVVENGVTWDETRTMNLATEPYRGGAAKSVVQIDGPTLHRQYSYGPVGISAGTMVDVRFDAETTTEVNSGNHQRFGRSVIQSTAATATTGTTLCRQMQSGITLPEHHSQVSHVGGNYYGSAVGTAYFNSVLYAYGNQTSPSLFIEGGPTPNNNAYGHFQVERRTTTAGNFYEDTTRNITSLGTTAQVLYSVGPMNIAANQVVEIRYQGCFQASTRTTTIFKIVRATSATDTGGTTVQAALAHRFHPNYVYSGVAQSTADRPSSALSGQFYNVVAYRTDGAAVTVVDCGEMEAVKR